MAAAPSTESYESPEDPQNGHVVRGPYLVIALNCKRPSEAPLRVSIAKAERIELRRAEKRGVHRDLVSGERLCQLRIADSTMSALHAFIVQDASGAYRLWDCGSKNGTTLNGHRIVEPTSLVDGDLIAVGCTYVLFRSAADCYLHEPFDVEALDEPMATANPTFARKIARAALVAQTTLSVLITGPSGSGRGTAARWIHQVSGRSGPFVHIACKGLLDQVSAIRRAKGGTLYLDGIEDLTPRAAAVVGSVLDPSEWGDPSRDGGAIDVRLVASGLPKAEAGLPPRTASRVAGYVFEIPPLARRPEDLGMFIAHALRAANAPSDTSFERPAARALLGHRWPGNARELRVAIRHGLALARGAPIGRGHLPEAVVQSERVAEGRRKLISLLQKHRGNVSAIARELKVSRIQVHRIAREHDLTVDDYRNE